MGEVRLPIGNDSFRKVREDNGYYADKTGFIEELLSKKAEVNLFTRPRRFGKTLTMSMLSEFFDIRKQSRNIFDGTKIAENKALCEEWMNQYPVIFLTLKHAEGLSFESAFERLKFLISDWCNKNRYLMDSQNLSQTNKELFHRLWYRTETDEEVMESLYSLSAILYEYYGKQVIILIDEYDVPLARADEIGYYREMTDVLRVLMGKALKTNEYLKFAVITGCLRIAKESIFTGLNNLYVNSISSEEYSEYFGFTEPEVLELLQATGLSEFAPKIKKWYNGYCFGKREMYCPWDVLNYVSELRVSSDTFPGNYWKNTSHNGIIRSFIDRTDLEVNEKFEILLSGGYICEKIVEDLTYDVLHASEENLWSVLYLTGYLTKAIPPQEQVRSAQEQGRMYLRIPNEEVKTIFAETIATWFTDTVKQLDRKPLFDAFWEGKEEEVSQILTDLLFETISYYDYREDYYHAFLVGIFTGAGYAVQSNKKYGLGRPDIVVKDRKNRRVIIMEVKHSKTEPQMEEDAKVALEQIDVKQYAREFLKGFRTVVCYGMAFCEKECLVRSVE